MASGRLAAVNPSSLTLTTVYTAPANKFGVVTINVYNQGSANSTVELSIVASSGTTPTAPQDFIEYKTVLDAGAQMERTGIVLSDGQTIKILTSGSDIGVMVWGIETDL